MISRKQCREIARDWVINRAIEEQHRRLNSVSFDFYELSDSFEKLSGVVRPEDELAARQEKRQKYEREKRSELIRLSTEMLLMGGYDPPTPRIPPFWRRWFMDDWIPPEPDSKDWPMCTKDRADA